MKTNKFLKSLNGLQKIKCGAITAKNLWNSIGSLNVTYLFTGIVISMAVVICNCNEPRLPIANEQ